MTVVGYTIAVIFLVQSNVMLRYECVVLCDTTLQQDYKLCLFALCQKRSDC